MRNRTVCFLLALVLCFGLTACSGETVPFSDEAATTTTQASTSAEATTTTTTAMKATTTTATPTTPFVGVTIAKIDLYDTHRFQMEEAVFVQSLTEATEVENVTRQLSATSWEYYPNQDKWVKYEPLFAEWALVLTDTEGKQHVLHLLDETVGWASLGTFEAGLSYADIIAQAKAHDKEGIDDFGRYQIDKETLAYLLSLF